MRKLSVVSAAEMDLAYTHANIMFERYKDPSVGGITPSTFTTFCTDKKLFDRRLKSNDPALIFEQVKLKNQTFINFERFKEAIRKVGMKKQVPFQQLMQEIHSETVGYIGECDLILMLEKGQYSGIKSTTGNGQLCETKLAGLLDRAISEAEQMVLDMHPRDLEDRNKRVKELTNEYETDKTARAQAEHALRAASRKVEQSEARMKAELQLLELDMQHNQVCNQTTAMASSKIEKLLTMQSTAGATMKALQDELEIKSCIDQFQATQWSFEVADAI
jgi:hypothetical protein